LAATITWDSLRQLAAFRAENGCAISLYLDLDPTDSPTPRDATTRVNSLLDEGLKSDGASRKDLTHDQRQGLKSDFERIGIFFEQEFSRDGARGLAVYCSGLDNYWRTLPLMDSVSDEIKVGRELYLTPLVPLVGRGEGALVAVVSREQGRLFRLRGGRLEDLADHFDEQPRRHDQGGWSQANYQRHIDNLTQEHLRTVAEDLARHVRRLRSVSVVVVSAEEIRSEFAQALPKDAQQAIVGWTHAAAHATPAELLAVALPELEQRRKQEEAEILARWREEASRNARAASGWGQTLEASSDGRVDLLLFQAGVQHEAWQCPACGRVGLEGGRCPLDGTGMEPRDEGLDLAVHQTLAHGGSVWAVQHHRDLEPVEGIGALLRY
jgi:peptide chain release factor subunit 1